MNDSVKDIELGPVAIEDIEIDKKSRDDIPAILIGLQEIYVNASTRERLFVLLRERVAPKLSHQISQRALPLWSIVVLGVLKAGLDCTWDHLEWWANQDIAVRQMLGIDVYDKETEFEVQMLIDNVGLLTPDMLREIYELLLETGHGVVRKHAWRALKRAR